MATSSSHRWRLFALLAVFLLATGVVSWRFCDADSPRLPSTEMDLPAAETDEKPVRSSKPPLTHPLNESGRIIHGHVVQPNGEPMADATVRVISPGSTEPKEVQTDASGAFEIDNLALDFYAVEATREGFGPAAVIGVVPGGAPLRLVLQTGKEIEGYLVRRGKAVAGGVVHIGGPGMFPQRAQPAERNGRFRIGGLQLGMYELIAVAPGASSGFIDPVHIDSESETDTSTLDIEMKPAPVVTLRFRGRRGHSEVESGVVTISSRPLHVLSLNALIADGEAVVDFLPPGEYWIRVRAPGFMPHEGRFWVTKDGGEVDIHLKRGASIEGEVLDEANNPVRGARVRAVIETESGGHYDLNNGVFEVFHRLARPDGTPFWWPTSSYSTDRNGRFEISGVPEGEVTLVVSHAGHATGMSRPLHVQHDEQYRGIRVVLSQGYALRGRVEDENGGPLSGASVSVAPSMLPAWISGQNVLTDRSGAFTFEDLPSDVQVSVRHPDYGVSTETLKLAPKGKDDHIIRLKTMGHRQYTGRVLRTQKGPAQNARVWFMSGTSHVPVCSSITDSKGHFTASDCTAVPDGIIIYLDGYAPLIKELSNPDTPQDWVLRAGGELDVVSQRQPVSVRVEANFYLPTQAARNTTFDLERWERHTIQRLAPGKYDVICQAQGYAPSRVSVEVAYNQRAEAVCPHPHRIAAQDVIVVDKKGSPVEGAEVWFEDPKSSVRKTTDAKGRVSLEGDPGRWVTATATHARWGQGEIVFQLASEKTEPLALRLEYPIGGKDQDAFIQMLKDWGLNVARDNRTLIVDVIDEKSPAANIGFRRGDELLWARGAGRGRLSVGVQRRHQVVVFELIQGDL